MATNMVKPDNQPDQKWSIRLAELRDKIKNFLIQSPDDFRVIGEHRKAAKDFIQEVKWEKDPLIKSAEDHVSLLKKDRAKYIDPANEVVEAADKIMAAWNEKKRLEAEAETRRLNEEARVRAEREAAELKRKAEEKAAADKKAAEERAEEERKERERQAESERKAEEKRIEEARTTGVLKTREANKLKKEAEAKAEADKKAAADEKERKRKQAEEDEQRRKEQADRDAAALKANVKTVEVKPAYTAVAGRRGGGTWKVESLNFDTLLQAYVDATPFRRLELRPFIQANEQEIGRTVREDVKDKAKAEALIPGTVVKFHDR